MNEVTRILSAIEEGEAAASNQLLPLVYDELRRLAARNLENEVPGQTLQATALVHEAYLRLVDVEKAQHWNSRAHFFGAAAEAMRRILVERARSKQRVKHGGQYKRVDLNNVQSIGDPEQVDLIALDEALTRFAEKEPVKAELVKLRYFAGLIIEDAADVMGISRTTAARYWTFARVWLYAELRGDSS